MIKVNLLKDHTIQSRISPAKAKASPMGVSMLLVLALVGTALGASWFYLHTEVVNLTRVRDRLRTENTRLQRSRTPGAGGGGSSSSASAPRR